MSFQTEMRRIAEEADSRHPDSIDSATTEAEKAIRALPGFKTFVDDLVHSAVRSLINDSRHVTNVSIKRDVGAYGGPSKVVVGRSTAVQYVNRSVYDLRIAGTALGLLRGSQLGDILESEQRHANGHTMNAEVLKALVPLVPDSKQVREAVTESKLRQIIARVRAKYTKETSRKPELAMA